jgi:hypothetical protein
MKKILFFLFMVIPLGYFNPSYGVEMWRLQGSSLPKLIPQQDIDISKVKLEGWKGKDKEFLNKVFNNKSFSFPEEEQRIINTMACESILKNPKASDDEKLNAINGLLNSMNFLGEKSQWTPNILERIISNENYSLKLRSYAAKILGKVIANLGAGGSVKAGWELNQQALLSRQNLKILLKAAEVLYDAYKKNLNNELGKESLNSLYTIELELNSRMKLASEKFRKDVEAIQLINKIEKIIKEIPHA